MFTIGNSWWAIVLAVVLVFVIWYWTIRASHRVVERISSENPKLYNFSFRTGQRRAKRR